MHLVRKCGVFSLAAILLSLSACAKKSPEQESKFGQTVRGKVTYKGESVPYGFVLLYNPEKSLEPKTGTMAPAAVAAIGKDGTYEIRNAPSGPALFCIASDPDIQPKELIRASPMGAGVKSRERPSGGTEGPPGGSAGPTSGPPGPPPGPPRGGPRGGPPGKPSIPANLPGLDFNPAAKELTEEQKKMLKEIHKKYAAFGRSSLMFTLENGEQTIDLKLD